MTDGDPSEPGIATATRHVPWFVLGLELQTRQV